MSQAKPQIDGGDSVRPRESSVGVRAAAPEPPEAACVGRFERALVVDDDDSLRRSLVRFLRGLRAEVLEARTLQEALRLLGRGPDLVITDVRLPDGSGCAVAEMARRLNPQPLVVAMSGLASASEAFALAQWGVRIYLNKPFASREFMESMQHLVATDPRTGGEEDHVPAHTATSLAVSLAIFAQRHSIPEREMALVRLAVAGVPRSRCPAMLGVSENTCKTLIRRLLQRCGARNLTEIPRLVLMRQPELDTLAVE